MTYIAYNSSKAHNNNGVIAKGDFREYKTLTNAEKFGSRKGLTTVRELSEFHVMANGDLMLIGYYNSAMSEMENEATIATDAQMNNQFMTYEKYNSIYTYAVIKYNSYTKATIDILAKYKSNHYALLFAEKNNAIVVKIADLVVVDKGYDVYGHGDVLMAILAIALNAQFAKQWELRQGELTDTVNRHFATKQATNEAVVPCTQNEAKITNLQASQPELASLPDTDTDTVKVAIEVANFVTNYFGYTRPVILVKDNVSTLRYVDTLQLQFNISVTIVGNVACISELPDTDIADYLLSRFTSKVVKSITLAKYQPTITNLGTPTCHNCNGVVGSWQNCPHCGLSTSEFWDNVTAIHLDEIVSNE